MVDIARRIETWRQRCEAPEQDPMQGMAEAGLLAPAETYAEIAHIKAGLVASTGLLGVAGVWGGRQVISRYFIDGFGDDAQRAVWRGGALSVAISEPKVGAHPKLLTTRAVPEHDGFRINGEKAWVSNGPVADAFIVLAITAVEGERKRYSAFIVPRATPGVTLQNMAFHALRPSQHCGLLLADVRVPRSAMLGDADSAYETMALSFRDLEDAVGTFSWLGAFEFVLRTLRAQEQSDEAALSAGGLAALAAVFADGAQAVVAALDAGCLAEKAATLIGLRVLAAEWLRRARDHVALHGVANDAALTTLFADLDMSLSVARGPRLARQARLGRG